VGLNVTETVVWPLGVRVLFVPPVALSPVPVTVTVVTDTFAVPESVRVMDFVTGLPSVTLPKATLVALGVSCEVGAATPVPERVICTDGFVALLATVSVPLAAPVCVGSNVTLIVAVPFGCRSTFVPPLTLNPVPLTVTDEMVTSSRPWSVSTIGSDAGAFRVAFPKFRVVELGESCDDGAMPVPDSAMFIVGLEASLTTDRVPCALPVAVGAKATVIVVVWFGVSVTATPLFTLKFEPDIEIEEIAMFEDPASVSTTDSLEGEPTVTFPKLTVPELGESDDATVSPVDEPCPPSGLPASPQPVVATNARNTAAAHNVGAKRLAASRIGFVHNRGV
jgi:hypothetical protein